MKRIIIAFVAVLLVAAAVAAGCGKKSEAPSGAKAILDKSQSVADQIKSLKANGDAVVNTPQSEVKETKMTFEMEGNIISKTEVNARISATDQSGKKTDAYIVDGWAYSYSATTGWVKQKVEDAQEFALMTPNQINELSKYAEDAKQLPDEGNNYVISFNVGSKFFEQTLEGAEKSDSSPADPQTLEMAKALFKSLNMSMVMKIDKTTYYPSETTVKMSADSVPILGKTDVALKMLFTGYNQPVDVTLPPEAQAARELPAGTSGGLPTIPGLGL